MGFSLAYLESEVVSNLGICSFPFPTLVFDGLMPELCCSCLSRLRPG
jgi:hypothetical protein